MRVAWLWQRPEADVVGDAVDAPEGVDHERPAEASALFAEVDTEAGEDNDRDVVAAGAGGEPSRRIRMQDAACGEGVVADHLVVAEASHHYHSAHAARLRLQAMASQPGGPGIGATVEVSDFVFRVEALDPKPQRHAQ